MTEQKDSLCEMLGPHQLGPNDTKENGIYCGDARELARGIPDESVDLVFTDPVYDQILDYYWLSAVANRVLKPDSPCLVWTGTGWLDETIPALSSVLDYRWQAIWYQSNNMQRADMGYCKYASLLWYEKGKSKSRYAIQDLRNVAVTVGRQRQDFHGWAKRTEIIEYYLEAFSEPGAVVVDFFSGGGTVPAVCKMTGRKYLAFEIDEDVAKMARRRVLETQPPLIVPETCQAEMFT